MRIISGKYKNRRVETPEGLITRPLLSRVRKSLLDILQPHLDGAKFLDLFSGTGVMALEALSRGASYATSIDSDGEALKVAQANHQKICPEENYRIIRGDVLLMIPKLAMERKPFDVIGITPPFGKDLVNATMQKLAEYPELMTPETVVFAQHSSEEAIILEWPHLEHIRTKSYGRNVFDFFLPWET